MIPERHEYGWNSRYLKNGVGGGGATLLLDVDLGTSTTPTVGGSPTFDRGVWTGPYTSYYASSTSALSIAGTTTPAAPAYVLGGTTTTKTGMFFAPICTNRILQSEAPATTWTTVGSPSSVNNSVGTFLGVITYGTIVSAASGDGIQQTSGVAAASKQYVGSFYASVGSGTLGGTITIEGGSGGTPETQTTTFTATTTPQRFHLYASFSGSATGNVRLKITCSAAGTLRIGGMMLQEVGGPTTDIYLTRPITYVKTTTAEATGGGCDRLSYDISNVNLDQGTATYWVCPFWDTSNQLAGIGNVLGGSNGHTVNFMHSFQNNALLMWYNNTLVIKSGPSVTRNQWQMITFTWNRFTQIGSINQNGAQVATNTSLSSSAPSNADPYYVGEDITGPSGGASDSFCGLVGRVRVWSGVRSDTDDLALYNSEKSNYGL